MPLLTVVVSPTNVLVQIVSAHHWAFSLCWELSARKRTAQRFCVRHFRVTFWGALAFGITAGIG
jgi:hypothetical protein